MKVNKLRNESGSAMLLVILAMALVSIMMISFSTQVGNQIKSTIKADENMSDKYLAEGKVESELGDVIKDILDNTKVYAIKENISIDPRKPVYELKYFEIEYTGKRSDLTIPNKVDIGESAKITVKIKQSENNYILDSKFNIVLSDLKEDENIQNPRVEVGYKLNYEVIEWNKK